MKEEEKEDKVEANFPEDLFFKEWLCEQPVELHEFDKETLVRQIVPLRGEQGVQIVL